LTWELLLQLRRQGIRVRSLTHATGISSTGDPDLDRRLPFPERSDIPPGTIRAALQTRAQGGRVLAVGTSVVRALEGRARQLAGNLRPGIATTDLILDGNQTRFAVDGILTGLHEVTESHFRLLEAFAERALLDAAHAFATERGYLSHEFGDACLLLPYSLD
jgi:S-adenosylmethionine:tRNA ribosyltransferase-isomerase